MKNRKKWLITLCALLLVAISIAGTMAYLTHKTEKVENTFTVGKLIDKEDAFVLKEHKATADNAGVYELDLSVETNGNSYTVLPGVNIPKDPFVRTDPEYALLLDAYVFVEVVESEETGSAISYEIDTDTWKLLDGAKGPNNGSIYYYGSTGIAKAGAPLGPVYILKKISTDQKEIKVSNVEIDEKENQFGGQLDFYGYMIQAAGFITPAEAWEGLGY